MAITGNTLSALSQQMPGQNQKVAQGLQEAAKTQMRQQLGGQGPLSVQQVQAVGQQAAAQKGQAALQTQQQGAQQAQKLGGLAINQEQMDSQLKLQARQLDITKQSRLNTQALNNLDSRLKAELLDSQFKFQQDELGRTLFNERQLADYKIQTAKSDLEMRNFEDKMRQASQRRLSLLKAAQAKVEQELQQSFDKGQQVLNQEQHRKLAEAKHRLEEKIRREQAARANRASMFSAGGTIIGTVIGAMVGGPPGAAVGANIGSGIGSAVYGATEGQED